MQPLLLMPEAHFYGLANFRAQLSKYMDSGMSLAAMIYYLGVLMHSSGEVAGSQVEHLTTYKITNT